MKPTSFLLSPSWDSTLILVHSANRTVCVHFSYVQTLPCQITYTVLHHFLRNSSWTFPMLTLSDHQFACQFLLIGFHPTRITAVSLCERIKWFFFLQQCQGPYQGIKLSLYLLLIILSYASISLPSWSHEPYSFPLWLTAVIMMLTPNEPTQEGNPDIKQRWQAMTRILKQNI